MKSDIGCFAIMAIIMVILFCISYEPSAIAYVLLPLTYLILFVKKRPYAKNEHMQLQRKNEIPQPLSSTTNKTTIVNNLNSDDNMVKLSKANKWALDQLYGRRGTSINDRMTEHYKRIGRRDENAVVTQIRARRNNSIEPYYRQELSQHGNKKWWDPDSILALKATPEQQETIMKGPRPNW